MRELKVKISDGRRVRGPFTLLDIQEGRAGIKAGETVIEFTGFYDKHGAEIYDGDTLASPRRIAGTGKRLTMRVCHAFRQDSVCFGHGSFGTQDFSGFVWDDYIGALSECEIVERAL